MLHHIKLPGKLIKGSFAIRINRFVARVSVNGQDALAHVPSSGRMRELLVPGVTVYLLPSAGAKRRTEYTLLLVEYAGILVCIDSLLPNRLIYSALLNEVLQDFTAYDSVRREYPYREGRIDFLLTGSNGRCLVEVKSVTLVERGEARFPDAPTQRGARHLEELALARGEGYRAAVIFVVQRKDGVGFTPNDSRDPLFGQALRKAYRAGVEVYALGCHVTTEKVILTGGIPVLL